MTGDMIQGDKTGPIVPGNKLQINTELLGRALMAASLGMQFGGERDVYTAAGYDRVITPASYVETWRRGDIAKRIVNAFPDETWRLAPALCDGEETLLLNPNNAFLTAWQQIVIGGQLFEDGETQGGLLADLRMVDRLTGLGRYGVLLFGIRDGKALSEPAERGSMKGPQDLLYVECYPEIYAKIMEVDTNEASPRYNRPVIYQLTTHGGNETAKISTVHWTRVLHIAEDGGKVYGVPRLEAAWNRLTDMLKTMAASGEAAWKLMQPGYVLESEDGYEAPDQGSEEWTQFKTMIDDFVHNLRRWFTADGMKVTTLGGKLQDPSHTMEWNINLISAATGIPKRILLGSEAGELASSQDDQNWADVIETRQQNHAWPRILLPAVNKLRWYGVLPEPSGAISAKWQPLVKSNKGEINQAAASAADAMQKAGIRPDPEAFVRAYLPDMDPTKVTTAAIPAAPPAAQEVMASNSGAPFLVDEWRGYP